MSANFELHHDTDEDNANYELDAMMSWEEGSLPDADTIKLFQHLLDTGLCWELQGMYGRMAKSLMDAGYIGVKH